ncbi:MAG TPA: DUF2267 domain-containing protein [Candidatus Binataceae bacterium]|nr:DUF2267 domain-containing protein [Candidatus Binataceae bacterium]
MKDKEFVGYVADRFGCEERRAEMLIFAVFQELRDRLTPHEAADVEAQLPASLKMLWSSFDYPGRTVRRVHEYQFLDEVRQMLGIEDLGNAEEAVAAVFNVLQLALGSSSGREGEARHVFSQLPADLKELWLQAGNQNRTYPSGI